LEVVDFNIKNYILIFKADFIEHHKLCLEFHIIMQLICGVLDVFYLNFLQVHLFRDSIISLLKLKRAFSNDYVIIRGSKT